jgi:hypothetical protein
MTPIPPRDNTLVHSMTAAVILGTTVGAMVIAGLAALILRISLARLSASLRNSLNEVQAQMTVMVQTMVSVYTTSVSCLRWARLAEKLS